MKKSSHLPLDSTPSSSLTASVNVRSGATADSAFAQSALGRKLMATLADPATSSANRAVAEQLLRNPVRATAWGIEELAANAHTSAATLSRFARTLGFSGFAAMRDAMAQVLQSMLQPVEKLRDVMAKPSSKSAAVMQSLEAGLNNTRSTAQGIDEAMLNRITEHISKAGAVYTMGFGISSHLAAMLALDLQPFCSQLINAVEFGGTEVAAGRLMNIKSKDVLIVISFPRYAQDAVQLASYARDRGAHVVAITDSMASPLVPIAHDILLAAAGHPVISSSCVSTVLVIEALVTCLMVSKKEHLQQAGRLTEAISDYLYTPNSGRRKR
jgi:DNA-binding MurR/RpiR family transcriptional regulator